ncbi:MAG: hypothetical protein DHS20C20_17500 [Ardenticatenaceae bacterium]|nr:MAG: hypothetical protein DHS20C20_17500 [Ardenticatenaceae bacterium]
MNNPDLGQFFKFAADDVASNRQGQLSSAQQARWDEAGQWSGSVMKTAVPRRAVGSVISKRAKQNGARYAVYYLDDDTRFIVSLEKMN